ncbi:putative disease resistance protein RGA3 [Corylus avellana]|uniref:putative disease resistance protein RGA3 n=1 Tax=Corylus avellana TaxID=13451 RepID=UPI00286CCDDF|nr:putative disease resistance protein RGA3 [Corylus avellana]
MAHGLPFGLSNHFAIGELENVGDMCIQDLLSRSFFQDVHNSFWDFRYWFKMHDLFHDLACKVAQDDCSIVDCQTQTVVGTVRHLSFSHNGQVPQCDFDTLSSGVRTTLFPTEQQELALVQACISRFKYLRVLSLSNSSFEVLPNSIGTLKHLKYLDLAGNDRIEKLPDSICKLYNLQTLLLHECRRLELLPKDIREMRRLRYLTVTTTSTHFLFEGNLIVLPPKLRVLRIYYCTRLETLFGWNYLYQVGRSYYGRFSLPNLQTLVIADCKRLTSLGGFMWHLFLLENLVILNCDVLSLTGEDHWYPSRLKKLKICDLPKLEVLPQWLKQSANNLQFVTIENCENFMALPEWLPSLKSLHTLEILNCSKLSSLPEGMDRLTALKELKIVSCPELIRKCKEEDWSKITHIPTLLLIP